MKFEAIVARFLPRNLFLRLFHLLSRCLGGQAHLARPPGVHVETTRLSELKSSFVRMGYPDRTLARLDSGEPMAELPFVLKVGDRLVRGRIDAVYELPGGGLEIVDFKTGAEVERPGIDQLRIYAAALALLGVMPQGPLRLTYAYLASERTESRSMPPLEAVATLTDLTDRLSRLTARSNRDHVPAGIGLPGDEPGPGSATRSLL